MKRLFTILLLCLFSVLLIERAEAGDLEMYPITNTTNARVKTQVSTSTIVPGKDVILGYELFPFNAACVDPFVELHDAAATGDQDTDTGGTMFSANELDTDPLTADVRIFPKPKNLALGLSVNLGGYTGMVIYYERRVN